MRHILLLTPGFPQSDNDTTCIPSLQALVWELQEKYHQEVSLQVVTFHYPFKQGSYKWKGIPCWSAGGQNSKLPFKLWTWLKVIQFVIRLHKNKPVDIIHSFWLQECTFIGQLLSHIIGAHHIAHAMGRDVLPLNVYVKFLNRKKITLVANSPFTAHKLVTNFNWNPQSIIPFGIRESDFKNVQVPATRQIDILAVGSLSEIKNHQLFIELFFELKKIYPQLRGKIIGEGPLRQSLEEKIKIMGLQHSIELTGELARPEVLQIMNQSKILLHTAEFESAAYVFLEALYSGMNVVSFKTGYLPDSLNGHQCADRNEMLMVLKKLLDSKSILFKNDLPKISDTASEIYNLYKNIV